MNTYAWAEMTDYWRVQIAREQARPMRFPIIGIVQCTQEDGAIYHLFTDNGRHVWTDFSTGYIDLPPQPENCKL
jgi:hypothetical protein